MDHGRLMASVSWEKSYLWLMFLVICLNASQIMYPDCDASNDYSSTFCEKALYIYIFFNKIYLTSLLSKI